MLFSVIMEIIKKWCKEILLDGGTVQCLRYEKQQRFALSKWSSACDAFYHLRRRFRGVCVCAPPSLRL